MWNSCSCSFFCNEFCLREIFLDSQNLKVFLHKSVIYPSNFAHGEYNGINVQGDIKFLKSYTGALVARVPLPIDSYKQ